VGYSAEDVAKLIGVSVRQVRSYVRDGFLAPAVDGDGKLRFSFQDVVLLRTAAGLTAASIAPARVRRPLTGVAIAAEGNRIIVRDGGARWNPESGQVLFDFRVAELAEGIAELKPKAPPPPAVDAIETAAAEEWYQIGCGREDEGDGDGAIAAYRRAIEADGALAEAHVNLGRLLHERGDREAALQAYGTALELRPGDPLAAFNLGVALEDAERLDDAAAAYQRAIAADPQAADAHYNLAGVFERLGDRASALRHLRTYKKLTGR
jgi:tetratricopeptide (TPR) repeat protein